MKQNKKEREKIALLIEVQADQETKFQNFLQVRYLKEIRMKNSSLKVQRLPI